MDWSLHISVQMLAASLRYRIVPAHLGYLVAGGFMTPVVDAGIDHSEASSCLLCPCLCPCYALKYCGSKSEIRPEINIAQEKKVRREQGFHVGWGLSCWYYSRAALQINWVYLPQLLMLLVTCTGQVCSWKKEVLWLQQSKAVPKAPSPEWRYS